LPGGHLGAQHDGSEEVVAAGGVEGGQHGHPGEDASVELLCQAQLQPARRQPAQHRGATVLVARGAAREGEPGVHPLPRAVGDAAPLQEALPPSRGGLDLENIFMWSLPSMCYAILLCAFRGHGHSKFTAVTAGSRSCQQQVAVSLHRP
jgi:hypothetical protein